MKTVRTFGVIGLFVFGLFLSPAAGATDQFDIAVALKTLPLLTAKIAGPVIVMVVYDPASPKSKADAEKIKSVFDSGIEAPGDIKLISQLASTTDLSGLSNAKIAFVASGLPAADYADIGAVAGSMGVLTISTDIDCVKANKCVLGITSKPQVQVYYSPAAAEAARISFASAFTMLAKQVGSM
jgi:hypothetical protein